MSATVEFLLVKQAAKRLGVSANTIRAWASTGKLQEYRHPVNNYRLFRKQDINALLEQIENPQPIPTPRRKPR